MNGLTQSTTAKILALNPATELDVLHIIDEALSEGKKPHAAEAESCRRIVNETNERAAAEVKKATDALAERMNELIEVRSQLEDARSKVAAAAKQIGGHQEHIQELKGQLEVAEQRVASVASQLGIQQVLYNELIMAVGNKYEGESRHETALRYIQKAETTSSEPAQQA